MAASVGLFLIAVAYASAGQAENAVTLNWKNPEVWKQDGMWTVDEVEFVLENPEIDTTSRSTGRPCCFGYTPAGEYIIVVYEQLTDDAVYPVTAYHVPET